MGYLSDGVRVSVCFSCFLVFNILCCILLQFSRIAEANTLEDLQKDCHRSPQLPQSATYWSYGSRTAAVVRWRTADGGPGQRKNLTGLHMLTLDNNTLPQRGSIGEFLTNFRRPKNHRKTVLTPPETHPILPQMVPKCDPRW